MTDDRTLDRPKGAAVRGDEAGDAALSFVETGHLRSDERVQPESCGHPLKDSAAVRQW